MEGKIHIRVFEHQLIRENEIIDGECFTPEALEGLRKYYGDKGVPYFSLTRNGVCFNKFVGVLQVGKTTIEVLPKADKYATTIEEKGRWQKILIDMLRSVGGFDIKTTSTSQLRIKTNSILDLYFELFVSQIEYLLHQGLVKRYRKREGNITALKGSLKFEKHLSQNIVHKERFYVRYTIYGVEHVLHMIFYKTICLLNRINTNPALQSRISGLLLNFPEMPDIKIDQKTFDRIILNRKTQSYKDALGISRLLLLHYHPDLSKGQNDVLALMFDMNNLWEKFVLNSLRKHRKGNGFIVTKPRSKTFWQPREGYSSPIRPDILINYSNENVIVLDTKWKNLSGNPSASDLRQLYVYHEYYFANKVALVYPGVNGNNNGLYSAKCKTDTSKKECSVISIEVNSNIKDWQVQIGEAIKDWLKDGQPN